MATKKAPKVPPRPAAPALLPSPPKAADDLDKVRELVRILEDSTLSELSYEDSVIAVRLSRATAAPAAAAPLYAMPPSAHAPAASHGKRIAAAGSRKKISGTQTRENLQSGDEPKLEANAAHAIQSSGKPNDGAIGKFVLIVRPARERTCAQAAD